MMVIFMNGVKRYGGAEELLHVKQKLKIMKK